VSIEDLKIHHLGIAVASLDESLEFYQNVLNFVLITDTIDDPIQKVRLCFLKQKEEEGFQIELIQPLNSTSPVNGYLSKGIGAYHICYEVPQIEKALEYLRTKQCIVVSLPVPAVAFEGRRIAWCFTPTKHLIELVEVEE
jgi:methylmalonyl-CoA/ethylmalonyl-CoA epimerase